MSAWTASKLTLIKKLCIKVHIQFGLLDNSEMRITRVRTMAWASLGALWMVCGAGCSLVMQYPVTSASAGVWGATGKGPTDHAVSNVTQQDCDLTRVIDLQPVCQERQAVEVQERSFRSLGPGR